MCKHNLVNKAHSDCDSDVHAKKEGVVLVTTVVLMQPFQGDAICFKSTLIGLPEVDCHGRVAGRTRETRGKVNNGI